MSNPTATGGHHPSCRESDKDLVWFCNQCGLKESAEPATGEWTAQTVMKMFGWRYKKRAEIVATAHNNALAAEREKLILAKQMVHIEGKRANEAQNQLLGVREIIVAYDAAEDIPAIDALRDIKATIGGKP